jgi:hypothetical protein
MRPGYLTPLGCPPGIQPSEWRAVLLERIDQQAAILSALVDALDLMDGDCDLEANGDAEPWLGWLGNGAGSHRWDGRDDLEIDDPDSRYRLPIVDLREEAL